MVVEVGDTAARLLAEFAHALESGQLVAYFQPEVELSSGRVVAAEALARWEHPELGTLPPALFVPLAEKLGLMTEFTGLMLRSSLAQHRTWAAGGLSIPVSVNVGPESVTDPEFPAVVAEYLRNEQVPGPLPLTSWCYVPACRVSGRALQVDCDAIREVIDALSATKPLV
jgi:diguanylate cyclase